MSEVLTHSQLLNFPGWRNEQLQPKLSGVQLIDIPYSTLSKHPLSSPPVSLAKSWSLATSLNKFYIENFIIKNYFKKDLLNFLFIRYDTAIIKQSSSYLFEKFSSSVCFCKLSMKLARAISSSSSSCTFDHLKSKAFSSL